MKKVIFRIDFDKIEKHGIKTIKWGISYEILKQHYSDNKWLFGDLDEYSESHITKGYIRNHGRIFSIPMEIVEFKKIIKQEILKETEY